MLDGGVAVLQLASACGRCRWYFPLGDVSWQSSFPHHLVNPAPPLLLCVCVCAGAGAVQVGMNECKRKWRKRQRKRRRALVSFLEIEMWPASSATELFSSSSLFNYKHPRLSIRVCLFIHSFVDCATATVRGCMRGDGRRWHVVLLFIYFSSAFN